MARMPERDPVYTAAERFVEEAIRTDGSLFTPGAAVWSLDVLDDLHERFVENPDASGDPFEVKFERQLSEAPDRTIQLAAEVLYVHFLPASSVKGARKRALISGVLSWMEAPAAIPPGLDVVLDEGLMNMGVAFNTGRNFSVAFVIDAVRAIKRSNREDRTRILGDPWRFREFLMALPIHAAQSQREALLHIVFPDDFENIASGTHKRAIVSAFPDRTTHPEDMDQALADIRASLEAETGDQINFYGPDLARLWQPQAPEPVSEEESGALKVRRAWLIRGTEPGGHSIVPEWLDGAYVSIGWQEVGDIPKGTPRNAIRRLVEANWPDSTPGRVGNSIGIIDRFLNRMAIGDLVAAPKGSDLFVGVVTSGPQWVPEAEPDVRARRRSVEWANTDSPIPRASVSPGLYSKMRTLLTLTDITEHADELATSAGIGGEVITPPSPGELVIPPATSALSERLLLPLDWLQQILELLIRRRQLVFYGPPGTGKTYVAQEVADHITADGGTFRLVQFHPSYTYEDFFEGFRPRSSMDGSGVTYELVAGPLREMAEAASGDPANPYVLIIDEINRANLAKVFGELYFLLEYRDHATRLLYSQDEDFTLPMNLFFIGTMNTADRSIALVDPAMRRRFYFVGFFPDREPIASLLTRWLAREEIMTDAAGLLAALNREIGDPDFSIGPSYLMNHRIANEGELELVWEHAIMPLLTEHFFGTELDIEQSFSLASLRGRRLTELPDVPAASGESGIDADDA